LCYFDKIEKTYTPVGQEIGINEFDTKSISETDNELWIMSEKRIFKTNLDFSEVFEYTISDGVSYGIEHLAACLNSERNRIFFGGQDGIQFFNTEELPVDTTMQNVVITNFKVFENEVTSADASLNGKSISYSDSITLGYKQNFITIDFSSMHFSNTTTQKYSYKLSGVNKDWVIADNNQNSVTYSNLKPYNYTFEVKVSSEHRTWFDKSTKLIIIIKPPFWQTDWFRFITIISIVSIIILIIRIREYNLVQDKKKLEKTVTKRTSELIDQKNKVEIQKEELQNANDVKNKFFNIIAHDLRNPVGSLVQLTSLLRENYNTLTEKQLKEIINAASSSSESTLELLEDLLIWARSQTNKINYKFEYAKPYFLAESEIQNLIHQAISKNIKVKNEISKHIDVNVDTSTIKTVFRNLLSNAIKFSTPNSHIEIGSEYQDEHLVIYMKDKGVGIPEEKLNKLFKINEKISTDGTNGEKGSGLGLNLCAEFIKNNNGTIWAKSEKEKGTTFFFTLPYKQKT
jgi:signal transduction histidine kinase